MECDTCWALEQHSWDHNVNKYSEVLERLYADIQSNEFELCQL